MNVAFSPEALHHPASFRDLNRVLYRFFLGRHRWIVPDLEMVLQSAWFQSLGAPDKEDTRDLALKSARVVAVAAVTVTPAGGVVSGSPGAWQVPATIAAPFLERPLTVVVEDSGTDGQFLRLILLRVGDSVLSRTLGKDTFKRLKAGWTSSIGDRDRVWIDVRKGGGAGVGTEARRVIDSSPEINVPLLVLVDSDRETCGATPTGTAGKAVADWKRVKRKYGEGWMHEPFVLVKREVENYIPEKALEQRYGGTEALRVWQALTPEERDYVDLKKLFTAEPAEVLHDPVYDRHLHASALRDRAGNNGAELDYLVHVTLSLW